MLPGLDGIEVCKQIQRERPVPVLMLTARDSETDLLVGLAVGADDYMTKPFSMRELIARVHALLRRAERNAAAAGAADPSVRIGDVELDRRVTPRSPRAASSCTSHRSSSISSSTSRRVPAGSRAARSCSEQVWGYDIPSGARTVDSHIRSMRRKLGADVVRTVHGVGYAVEEPACT